MRRRFSKSELAIRWLRLERETPPRHEPGLVMIQIDGLAYAQFQRALRKGNLPFLQRLLRRERYHLYDHYSGSGKHDGYIWGLASAGRYITQAFAILIGAFIVTTFSFEVLFIMMGTVSTAAAFYQAKILRFSRR